MFDAARTGRRYTNRGIEQREAKFCFVYTELDSSYRPWTGRLQVGREN